MNVRVLEKKIQQWLWGIEDACETELKLTLIVRNAEKPNADMIFTRDDLDEVIAAIENLKEQEPRLIDYP